jgi:hypothetical protein
VDDTLTARATTTGINLRDYLCTIITCEGFGQGGSVDEGMAVVALQGVPSGLSLVLVGVAILAFAGRGRGFAWMAAWAYAVRSAGAAALPRLAARFVSSSARAGAPLARLGAACADAMPRLVETVELSFAGLLRRIDAEPASGLSLPEYEMISAVRGVCSARTAFCFVVARPAACLRRSYGYTNVNGLDV